MSRKKLLIIIEQITRCMIVKDFWADHCIQDHAFAPNVNARWLYGLETYLEREIPADHCIQDNACAPNINARRAVWPSCDDLRSSIGWRPARFAQFLALFEAYAESKVDNLDVLVFVDKEVV